VTDQHITVRGCFFSGNRDRQAGAVGKLTESQEEDGTLITGLQFLGANDLTVEDVTVWNAKSFGVWIANGQYIHLSNVQVDNGSPGPPETLADRERAQLFERYATTDGVHFNGPIRYVTLSGLKLRAGDDAVAFNANDAGVEDMTLHNDIGPYVGQGPITDVTASDILLADALEGFRFYSSNQRVDRILITNVMGTVQMRMALLGHEPMVRDGNFGSVTFNNVDVDAVRTPFFESVMDLLSYSKATKKMWRHENEDLLEYPLFALDSAIESLTLQNITTRVVDGRTLIWVGGSASIQRMRVELNAVDPSAQATPLKLKAGSHIGRLSVALDWVEVAKGGRNPLVNEGGVIDELRWAPSHE
jgi:hypothetical protein